MQELVSDLKKKSRLIKIGGNLASRKKHIKRGKLLPRERINFLLDKNSRIISGDIVLDNREKSSFRN